MPEGKYTRLDISRWVRLCEQAIEDLNNEGVTLLMEHVKGRLNLFEFFPGELACRVPFELHVAEFAPIGAAQR